MQTFDFDSHFRRMERADEGEVTILADELRHYLASAGSAEEQNKRRAAWKQAIARLEQRSETELALVRELTGTPV